MYQQGGANSKQNSYLRLACFLQLKISKSSEATWDSLYKQLPLGAACLTPTVWENTLRFWEYLLYLMRPQLYQFVRNRIQNIEMKLLLVWHRRENSLLTTILWRLPVESQVSFPKFQNSLYFKILQARKKINLGFFSCLLLVSEARPWTPGVHRMDRAPGMTPSAGDSCSSSLPAEPSRGSPRGPAALWKRTNRSGFFQQPPDSFQAARGAAARLLHSGRDLTAADVLQDSTDRGLVAISPFDACFSNSQDCAKIPVSSYFQCHRGKCALCL